MAYTQTLYHHILDVLRRLQVFGGIGQSLAKMSGHCRMVIVLVTTDILEASIHRSLDSFTVCFQLSSVTLEFIFLCLRVFVCQITMR